MSIIYNPDKNHVKEILKTLSENGNYCPCAIYKDEETKCMCKDFREKIKDADFTGYCHCGLYYKTKD